MGFRFQKRIKIGKGLGINISKSGITPSYRNKRGAINKKGYSVRTGIPGLTYRKSFNKTKNNGCILFLFIPLVVFGIISSCSSTNNMDSEKPCIDTNCADYTSQSSAQSAYNADPDCRGDLDADNDGIACEEPGNSVTICPTTSNCGCSNKTKSQCEVSPCCKWIVGEGCKCN